ncbi:MAG TPA: thioredoxin family protein, partial [Bdellovibrio sp.]|nr:thioredoxin family protein [Bdellovibrio sp.]
GFNLDRTVLTQLSKVQTEEFENKLIDTFHPSLAKKNASSTDMEEDPLRALPISLDGATKWLNSPPLSFESLKGKVVLVDFWTYSCINCLRTLPYVKSWAAKYKNQGLVVIGVHTPEFAFEKDPSNVMKALRDLEITYPIAMDNDYVIWNSFENRYWPAHYFIDRTGKIRHHHFGEGGYEESEKVIQELLQEGSTETTKVAAKNSTSPSSALSSTESAPARGVQMPAQMADVKSPETYVGYSRAQNLRVQPELEEDEAQKYQAVKNLQLNEWSLSGTWLVNEESATLLKAGGQVIYRFHARDLHLVLGPQKEGSKIKFRVTLDGQAPGKNHGVDTDEKGYGVIDEHRLYQLIRQQDQDIRDRTFEIEFLDSGVAVFAFTFG